MADLKSAKELESACELGGDSHGKTEVKGESTKTAADTQTGAFKSRNKRKTIIIAAAVVAVILVIIAVIVGVVLNEDEPISYCSENPCQHGGTCSVGNEGYTCDCVPGYSGKDCQIDIDECSSNPCQNGGTCMDGVNYYTCQCRAGYTGTDCHSDIDECLSIPCNNGATCIDEIDRYTCQCVHGFTGDTCETDTLKRCDSIPCENGGTCEDVVEGFTCLCNPRYTGAICQTETNPRPADALIFEAVGDWGETLLPGQARVAEQMNLWGLINQPEFIITTGDNFYPNGILNTNDRQITNKWLNMYVGDGIGHLDWYTVVGNHDYGNDGSGNEWNQVALTDLQERWNMPALNYDIVRQAEGKDVHLIFFDTEGFKDDINNRTQQEEWLKNTLAASTAHWKIVIGHRPIYSAGNYGPTQGSVANFLNPLLEQHNVDMYVCGHDHNMQHIHQLPNKTSLYPDYVISGGGGALWYTYDEEAHTQLNEQHGMEVGSFEMVWGFAGFTITADEIKVDYINADGEKFYSFTRKHRSFYSKPLVFEAVGDWGDTLLPGQRRVAAAMDVWAVDNHPEFIITTGDNFYPNGLYSTTDPQLRIKWLDMYVGDGIGHLDWYLVVGNHDYGDWERGNEWNQVALDSIQDRWNMPALNYDVVKQAEGKDVHLVFFDTEGYRRGLNNQTAQVKWLTETMANSTGHWKILVGHRPIYALGTSAPGSTELMSFLNPLLEDYEFDMFLCGHDHNLQHIHLLPEQTSFYPDHVVSGGGGALLYTYEEEGYQRLRDEFGMEEGFFKQEWGFVGFKITANEMNMHYIDQYNDEIYKFTRKHRSLFPTTN